jgi:MYXO-CTERM domain-containing protein
VVHAAILCGRFFIRAFLFGSVLLGSIFSAVGARAACPTPADVSMFMPPPYVPPNQMMACTQMQIDDYWTNCRDPITASAMKCQMWGMNNKNCGLCLESKRADPKWGPLVYGTGVIFLNVAGCADLQGFPACAKAYEKQNACESAACDQVCPVMDQQTFMDWQKCVQTADTGGCKSYADATQMACAIDASALQTCINIMSFKSGYDTFAPMFCGGVANDGGVDGSDMDSSISDSGPMDASKKDSSTMNPDSGTGAEVEDILPKTGCHCDSSEGGGSGTAVLTGLVALALLRRKHASQRYR